MFVSESFGAVQPEKLHGELAWRVADCPGVSTPSKPLRTQVGLGMVIRIGGTLTILRTRVGRALQLLESTVGRVLAEALRWSSASSAESPAFSTSLRVAVTAVQRVPEGGGRGHLCRTVILQMDSWTL